MLLSAFLLLLQTSLIVAIPLEGRNNGDVCQRGLYGELVPVLKQFSPAQVYCAQAYPAKCGSQGKLKKRTSPKVSTTTAAPSTTTKMTTSSKTTTKAANPKESALSKLLKQGKEVVSTLCSCIRDSKVSDRLLKCAMIVVD